MSDSILTIKSWVGRAGVGASPWVARVTGPSRKYPYERDFCDKRDHTGANGRSGHIDLFVTEPGIYELRGIGNFNDRYGEAFSGFIRVDTDGTHEILGGPDMPPSTVLTMALALAMEGNAT